MLVSSLLSFFLPSERDSTDKILVLRIDITTISTAKGLAGGAGSSMARNPFGFGKGDLTVMAVVAVVGGLVGAVAVL